jgi:hypothetical protein
VSDDRRRGFAATAPDSPDPELRGRVYAVPFEVVWQAALNLARGGLPRWSIESADDHEGIIEAYARGRFGAEHGIIIRIGLDADAQTTVAVSVLCRTGRDLGRARRRLRRFLRALDELARTASRRTAGRTA